MYMYAWMNVKNLRRLEPRRTDNSNALGQHNLVRRLGVQVARAHEAGLGGVGVDPAEDQQVVLDAVVEQGGLVLRLARVRRAPLLRDDQPADEQRVVNRRAAQDPAHLEAAPRIVRRDRQEPVPHRRREEHRPHRLPVLKVRCRSERHPLLLLLSGHDGTLVADLGRWGWALVLMWTFYCRG